MRRLLGLAIEDLRTGRVLILVPSRVVVTATNITSLQWGSISSVGLRLRLRFEGMVSNLLNLSSVKKKKKSLK
jgi:hypothetical protein